MRYNGKLTTVVAKSINNNITILYLFSLDLKYFNTNFNPTSVNIEMISFTQWYDARVNKWGWWKAIKVINATTVLFTWIPMIIFSLNL